MSSPIVPLEFNDVEHYLIRRPQHDIEYKSVAFWFYFFNRRFPLEDNWIVLPEQAPDENSNSRRRVDIAIHQFYPAGDKRTALVFIEVKRRGLGFSNVEAQALDAASRAIDDGKLTGCYAITAWGLKFRAWYVESPGRRVLNPLYGSTVRGDKQEYLSIETAEGMMRMATTIDFIKTSPSLRELPTLPGQHDALGQMIDSGTYYGDGGEPEFAHGSTQGIPNHLEPFCWRGL